MLWRLLFLLLALFWGVMNVQLWRAECGAPRPQSSPVPLSVVCQKLLTAPDSSVLSVFYQGRRIGYCTWSPAVGTALAEDQDDTSPEGQVEQVSGYHLQLEGSLLLAPMPQRLRFDCQVQLATNRLWQSAGLRVNLHPGYWELHSVNAEQTLHLKVENEGLRLQKVLSFAQLRSPESLLREMGVPVPPETLGLMGLFSGFPAQLLDESALHLAAFRDTLALPTGRVRIYRVEGMFLDRFKALLYLSQVGEILRVELPGEVLLLNDQFEGRPLP